MSSKKRNTLFDSKWIETCGDWLSKGEEPNMAKCKLCAVSFNVGLSGITSVRQHMATLKHKVFIYLISKKILLGYESLF